MPVPEREPTSAAPGRHGHLRRLSHVWIKDPVYFLTVCVAGRVPLLANARAHDILRDEWTAAAERHGWHIGRYVVMPDHVHFFASPLPTCKRLSVVVGAWKEWTAKRILADLRRTTGVNAAATGVNAPGHKTEADAVVAGGADPGRPRPVPARLWQPEFFDHVLRSRDSYGEKWAYVANNPVRAGLAVTPEAWPYAGHVHFDLPR